MIFRDTGKPTIDWNFLGTAVVLACIGVLLVYSATYYSDPALSLTKRAVIPLSGWAARSAKQLARKKSAVFSAIGSWS